jgi:CHASE3 domain sensor protein
MSIGLKLIMRMAFYFITAIGNSIFTFQLEKFEEEKISWLSYNQEVLLSSKSLLGSLKDTETEQRGFLLTKTSFYWNLIIRALWV